MKFEIQVYPTRDRKAMAVCALALSIFPILSLFYGGASPFLASVAFSGFMVYLAATAIARVRVEDNGDLKIVRMLTTRVFPAGTVTGASIALDLWLRPYLLLQTTELPEPIRLPEDLLAKVRDKLNACYDA